MRRSRFFLEKIQSDINILNKKFDNEPANKDTTLNHIISTNDVPVDVHSAGGARQEAPAGPAAPGEVHVDNTPISSEANGSSHVDTPVNKHIVCNNIVQKEETLVNQIIAEPAGSTGLYTQYFALSKEEKLIIADSTDNLDDNQSGYNDYYITRSILDLAEAEEEEALAARVGKYIADHEHFYADSKVNNEMDPYETLPDPFYICPISIMYTTATLFIISFLYLYCGGTAPQILAALITGIHTVLFLWSEPESMKVYVSSYWLFSIIAGSGMEYLFKVIGFLFDPFYKKVYNKKSNWYIPSNLPKVALNWAKRGGAFILSWCYFCMFAQKIRRNISNKTLHHIKLKGLKSCKVHKKFPTPDRNKIPIRFRQGLPFVSLEINGMIIDALLDTGSQYNLINSKIYDELISRGNDFEHFTHDVSLSSHSGPEISLYQKAARIPIKFLSDGIMPGNEKQIPFLIEKSNDSTNILGMKAMNSLEIEFGPGFKFLNLKPSQELESPPLGWKIDPKSSFSGEISLSCDSTSLSPKLEAYFEGLREYTGCITISDTSNGPSDLIDGTILHLTKGHAAYELAPIDMSRFPFKGKSISCKVAPCNDNCPSDDIRLATDIEGGEPLHYFVNQDHLMIEVDQINNLKTWLYQEDLIPKIFKDENPVHAQPDPIEHENPDPLELYTDPVSIDLSKYAYPESDQLSRADLEINIVDASGVCVICCRDFCNCTPSNLKNKVLESKLVPGRVYTLNNIILLSVISEHDILSNVKKLANAVCHYIHKKGFRSVRIGNKIKDSPGLTLTLAIFDFITNISKTNPDINPILYKTISSGSVHELQFNLENGQLEHRPELLSKTIGLSEDLLNPTEIAIVQEYEDDIKEVITESSPDLHKFLFSVFNTYKDSIISSSTDFGCLKHPDFMLDLKLKDHSDHLLPRHNPFHANAHMTSIVDKLCDHWTSIGLAEPSNITSHCSRLIIVHKKVSNRNFTTLKSEIEASSNYRFKTNLPSELYSVDPDILTVKQICQIYRVCLDSRDLNRLCTDTVQRSQNPEICLQNLQKSIGKTSDAPHNKTDFDQLRISDPYASYDFNYPESESSRSDIKNEINNVNIDPSQKWFYSSIDISSAHTSVRLTDRAQYYLNFITPSLRILRFVRAIFGLKAISSQFNGSLTSILRDLVSAGHIYIYADDILIVSQDIKTHLSVIAEISRRFARHGLKINLRKSKFGVTSFSYIGYIFTPEGIFLSQDRIDAITSFPSPTSKKGVQRLLGMLNFIQKCIPNYAFHLFPLLSLLSAKKFKWTPTHEAALNRIKDTIKRNLPLHYVPEDEQLTLFVDSSAVAGGGVLFAGEPNSENYRPVLYLSKKYSELEIRRNSALECEISMLLYALEKCQYFSNGIHPIRVKTDAKTIVYLLFGSRKTRNPKLGRMASKISEFLVLYDIQYEKPNIQEMMMADCISRLYYDEITKYPGDLVKHVSKDDISPPPPGVYSFQDLEKYVLSNNCVSVSKYLPSATGSHSVADPVQGADPPLSLPSGADAEGSGIPPILSHKVGPGPHGPDQQPENIDELIITDEAEENIFFRFHSINSTIPPTIDDLSWKNIILKQQDDPKIKLIRDQFSPQDLIEENPRDNYIMIKGVLYKRDNEKSGAFRIYIPDSLLNLTISSSHIQFGHMGSVKLTELLNLHFYNPDLSKTTKNIISKCHLCTLANPDCTKKQKIQAFRYASQPGEVLGLDFMKLHKDCGYENILVICDLFSGFTFLRPTKDQTAESAISALSDVFNFCGPPNCIRSDGQMSLLKSKKMKKFFAEHNIVGEIYPPNYAQHNPRTERTIRSIRELIRYANLRDGNFKWFKSIKMYNQLLNSIPRKLTFNNQTHFLSPFEIYFSRRKPLFKVAQSGRFSNYNVKPSSLMNESIKEFAKGALVALKEQYIDKTNKKGRDPTIKIGDCYVTINKSAKQGVPLKYLSRYNKNIFLCKRILGKNIIGIDIISGVSNYASVDNIKVLYPRESYFSELPLNIKRELGSSLDLKLDLNSRRKILSKLKLLKMYSNISSPVSTLNSNLPPSSLSTRSGSTDLIPKSLDTPIPVQNLTITDLGHGSTTGKPAVQLRSRQYTGLTSQADNISLKTPISVHPVTIQTGSESPHTDPGATSVKSPSQSMINKGKKLKNKIKKSLQDSQATLAAKRSPRPQRIRNPNRHKNRDPDFVYD